MVAIMRVVDGVGGAMVLDLNAAAGGGIMAARGEKVLAQTTLTDDGIGDAKTWWSPATSVSEVASRRISIPLKVQGTNQDDVAARIQALAKAVDTPWVLEVRRHGATTSGFLRCQPCAPQVAANINAVGSGGGSFADVQLAADTEPYAIGAQVDTGNLTWTQDPNSSTAFYVDVAGVVGDAPAPCVLRWNLTGLGIATHGAFWSVRRTSDRRANPTSLAGLVVQGEARVSAPVSGANVTASNVTGDSALSGNSAARFTFGAGAGTTDWGSVNVQHALTGLEAPGTYRLLARIRRSGGAAGVQLSVRVGLGAYTPQDYLFPASSVDTRVMDLGLVQVPIGHNPQFAAPIAGLRGAVPPQIGVQVFKSGAAGAGVVDIDWVALIPADEDAGYWRTQQQTAAVWAFADGYSGDVGFADADPVTSSGALLQGMGIGMGTAFMGGVPQLGPGTNRVYCVQGVTGAVIWPKTTSVTARIAYWPRYRWLP